MLDINDILKNIKCEDYDLHFEEIWLRRSGTLKPSGYIIYATYMEKDIVTGKNELQATRKWVIEPEWTKSQIVQTALKCILTSHEHRVRESFKFEGKRVFSPHFNIDSFKELSENKDFDVPS